jgi:hypothetical protein
VQERVRFMELDDVPAEVLALRVANRTVRGAELGAEGVLLYRRRVALSTEKGVALPQGMGLRQIIRLNLRHFLVRLDEPRHEECHYSPRDERFRRFGLPKVYHINLIARVVSGRNPVAQRWRVVLNKEGIVRMETVTPRVAPIAT